MIFREILWERFIHGMFYAKNYALCCDGYSERERRKIKSQRNFTVTMRFGF